MSETEKITDDNDFLKSEFLDKIVKEVEQEIKEKKIDVNAPSEDEVINTKQRGLEFCSRKREKGKVVRNVYKLICEWCKKPFRARSKTTKYCCDECHKAYVDSLPKEAIEKMKTEGCVKGRFQKGNKLGRLGKGKHNAAQFKAHMNELFRKKVTDKEFCMIVQKMIDQAKQGNNIAQKEILERVLGKVKEEVSLKLEKVEWTYDFDYKEQNVEDDTIDTDAHVVDDSDTTEA